MWGKDIRKYHYIIKDNNNNNNNNNNLLFLCIYCIYFCGSSKRHCFSEPTIGLLSLLLIIIWAIVSTGSSSESKV